MINLGKRKQDLAVYIIQTSYLSKLFWRQA